MENETALKPDPWVGCELGHPRVSFRLPETCPVCALRARVAELEAWISEDGLSVLIAERDRLKRLLKRTLTPASIQDRLDLTHRKETMELNKHYFEGACAPGGKLAPLAYHWDTFSVGVFEAVLAADGKRIKKGKVKVRVKGLTRYPDAVFAKAREIADALDAGTYTGATHVSVIV